MKSVDEKTMADAAYWGWMEEWTESIPETPLWVDMRRADYLSYPRNFFPTMASSFDPFTYRQIMGRAYTNLFSCLRRAGDFIFEIGCGSGFMSLEMARMGKSVFGFDLSKERIRFAKRYYESVLKKEAIPGSIRYFVGDAENLTLCGNSFDAVLCHGSLHHLEGLERILDGIYRILKPGGLLVAFEHRELDLRLVRLFSKMDGYVGRLWSYKRTCKLLDIIFRRAKKIVDHPIRPKGGSPMEDVSSHNMEESLDNCRMERIRKDLYSPFAFHFVERYSTVYDWRKPFKVPALVLLKFIDLFLEKAGFMGELIFWVGEKK